MASYHGNSQLELAKMEQIITEFFAKSLHIILESRCPCVSSRNYSGDLFLSSPSPSSSSSSSSSCPPRDRWFNLALRDCPAALENIDFWRQSNLEPMIIDIVLERRPNDRDPLNFPPKRGNPLGKDHSCGSDSDELFSEKIIERWVIQYESKKNVGNGGCSSSSNKRLASTSSHTLYKKSMLLLRSLYATVRLLPAYKLFRDLIASARIRLYNLSHRVSSFVEPFSCREEETDMQRLEFTPVETSCGRLCLSVSYHACRLDMSSEPSNPVSLQFIPEYVGSPLAEPLKRFPSAPVSRSSPASRRHSWSYEVYRASPSALSPSPSPTYSEFHASISTQHCIPPLPVSALPCLQDKASDAQVKNPSYDECLLSPTYSTSVSPSQPVNTVHGNMHKALVRCESAPVSTPLRPFTNPPLPNRQEVIPLPSIGVSRCPVSKQDAKFHHKAISTVDKLCVKDELGGTTGLKPSLSCPPLRSFSGSSSRLVFQDDYDDSDFSGAFFVGDDDTMTPGSSCLDPCGKPTDGHELGGGKSQDAAVGALVHMLKKAPPLDNQFANPANNNTLIEEEIASAIVTSKTLADALEELRAYSEMKDKLLKNNSSA